MTPEAFDAACCALPAATMDVQWGDDHVYKVGGRMFAVAGPNGACSFKAMDIAFEALTERERGRGRRPYLARPRWAFFDDIAALEDAEVAGWLTTAHELTSAKLTRNLRAELDLA